MQNTRPGTLSDETQLARYLVFGQKPGVNPSAALRRLAQAVDSDATVVLI